MDIGRKMKLRIILIATIIILGGAVQNLNADNSTNRINVATTDLALVEDAFIHGYTHNLVTDTINGKPYPTISIQCVSNEQHQANNTEIREHFSVWTRDLYWGALGWTLAGDDSVLERFRTSILALIEAKNANKADGHVKNYPNKDGRYYIPQAYCTGGKVAEDFYPYDAESQADFLLLTHLYWKMTANNDFISSIWDEIAYVTKTIELMDTNGNHLPDFVWGTYDYQYVGPDTEEPLMSAKASAAYRSVAQMAAALGKTDESRRLSDLAELVKKSINKPVSEGGLWNAEKGYYINKRIIAKGKESVDDRFIPYESLVPMFMGITDEKQNEAIFDNLDANFDKFYPLKWGPMFTAGIARMPETVIDCSTTTWLGFLDVYLRCKHNRENNRSKIYSLLIKHAYDVPAAPFAEGAGIFGYLTGGSGRAWDNGNFFHCFIEGIYGITKSSSGITVNPPVKMDGFALTHLNNVKWRDAVYNIRWEGSGIKIKEITLDGKPVKSHTLSEKAGVHEVKIKLTD